MVTGLGKSGHVARKIVATLCSTGTPAVFLHAAEAAHGDLGLYSPGDPTLMVSKSGNTFELLQLIPFLRDLPSQCIGILGNPSAPLASEMDVVLDASVEREADPEIGAHGQRHGGLASGSRREEDDRPRPTRTPVHKA